MLLLLSLAMKLIKCLVCLAHSKRSQPQLLQQSTVSISPTGRACQPGTITTPGVTTPWQPPGLPRLPRHMALALGESQTQPPASPWPLFCYPGVIT